MNAMTSRILLATMVIAVALASPALARESENGATVPTATQITDASGAIWTILLPGRAVLKDGKETGLADVLELWYIDHQV